jgi:hypothetical protein
MMTDRVEGDGQEVPNADMEASPADARSGGDLPAGPASAPESVLSILWDWTRSLAVAFLLFLVIRAFVVEAFKIPTSSMENTLLVGDFLLVNKAVYGAEIPARP